MIRHNRPFDVLIGAKVISSKFFFEARTNLYIEGKTFGEGMKADGILIKFA